VCRIPERFYTDHGPDFESNRMEQVAADIRMRLDYSMVGEPRGRGKIKRFFETVNDMFPRTTSPLPRPPRAAGASS
jgi:putative transposase